VQILRFNEKGTHLDTTEIFYIDYKETVKNNKVNCKHALYPNKIFETFLQGEGHMT